MKIIDCIPGEQVAFEDNDRIAYKILSTLNPNDLPNLDLWKELIILGTSDIIKFISSDFENAYYLLYTYYLQNNKEINRVFISDKEKVINFINDYFDEECGEGFDIIISDVNYNKVIMGNHDGLLLVRSDQYKDRI